MGLVLLLMVATSVVPLTVFAACALVVSKRWPRNVTATVPSVVAVLALLVAISVSVAFLSHAGSIRPDTPASKASLLSLGISEALNCSALFILAGGPALVLAYFLDRRARKRSQPAQL